MDMRNGRFNTMGVTAALALCLSCGSSSGGSSRGSGGSTGSYPSTGAAPVAEADFRQQFPVAFCNVIRTCCTQAGVAFNPTICQGFATATLDETLTYNAQAAGECLQLARATTTCDMSGEMSNALSPCDVVYSGSKALGEACESSAECAARSDGEVDCDGLDNVCAVTRRGVAGDLCTSSCEAYGEGGYICSSVANPDLDPHESVQCFREEGLSCGPNLTCDPLITAGQPCTSDDQCISNHYCASSGTERTCAPQLAVGGACETFTNACAEGNYCDTSNMCAAKKAPGQPCTGYDECQGSCTDNICEGTADDFADGFLALICGGSTGP